MFTFIETQQMRQRHDELTKVSQRPEIEPYTRPVPNVFDRLFAALKPTQAKQMQPTATAASRTPVQKPSLSAK